MIDMIKNVQSISLESRGACTSESALEPRAFRDALGLYASGITVIAGHDEDEPLGFTCQSFYGVSLAPPLISFSVMTNSSTYPRIRKTGRFSVNVLAQSQQSLSDQFGRKGKDRWAGVAWRMTQGRNPIIEGTLLWLDCKIAAEHQAGDHCIVIGEVIAMSLNDWHDGAPLLYFKGKYRHLHDVGGSAA
jgi:3-hydroxy-9,10-secoandrosta-1,3,5(10)-triene-9,17-dione monooxygenase reductase component